MAENVKKPPCFPLEPQMGWIGESFDANVFLIKSSRGPVGFTLSRLIRLSRRVRVFARPPSAGWVFRLSSVALYVSV